MQILYEDARIIVCIKPANVLSTDTDGGMPQLLRAYLGEKTACVKTVHRLDAAASGVMVFARSHKAAAILSEQVRSRTFQKEYLAVVAGIMPEKEGVLEDYLRHDTLCRKTFVCTQADAGAQKAVLSYRVLSESDGKSLVYIVLQTGRTHQIRVQFASRGFALCGDRKYGAGGADDALALWSYRVSFLHPQSLQPLSFSCAPPWTEFESRCLP